MPSRQLYIIRVVSVLARWDMLGIKSHFINPLSGD